MLARSIKKQRCLLCTCERSCSFPIKNGLKAALQSLTSNTPDQPIHQLLKDLQLLPHECTVVLQWIPGFQEMKEQITCLSLGANNCNPCPPPLTRKPKHCSKTDKNVNGEGPLETTTPLLTQSTDWQDMSRPLYSGCEQDTVACECI